MNTRLIAARFPNIDTWTSTADPSPSPSRKRGTTHEITMIGSNEVDANATTVRRPRPDLREQPLRDEVIRFTDSRHGCRVGGGLLRGRGRLSDFDGIPAGGDQANNE